MSTELTRADVSNLTAVAVADQLTISAVCYLILPGHDADYLRKLLRLPPPVPIQLPVYAYSTDATRAKELADFAGVSYLDSDGALDTCKKIILAAMDDAGMDPPGS